MGKLPKTILLFKERKMTNHQVMRIDTSALNRALVGFDNIFNDMEARFLNQQHYPPHNIVKYSEDSYEIQLAVTGFEKDEITVEIDQNQLIIRGQHVDQNLQTGEYLHHGLANRDFVKNFTLAEHMEVGQGKIKNGVLTIEINRVIPDALKPRILKLKAE
jgi:molecular chaperone IbpA